MAPTSQPLTAQLDPLVGGKPAVWPKACMSTLSRSLFDKLVT